MTSPDSGNKNHSPPTTPRGGCSSPPLGWEPHLALTHLKVNGTKGSTRCQGNPKHIKSSTDQTGYTTGLTGLNPVTWSQRWP